MDDQEYIERNTCAHGHWVEGPGNICAELVADDAWRDHFNATEDARIESLLSDLYPGRFTQFINVADDGAEEGYTR